MSHDPEFNTVKIEALTNSNMWETFFNGIVLNISELKKNMKQLGLNNNKSQKN